jgi:multiple sugar transport system permease protein
MSQISAGPTRTAKRGANYILLTVVSLLFVGPILWMVSGSLKSINEILLYPPTAIPSVFRWDNYAKIFQLQPFLRQFGNSVIVMAAVCVLTVLLSVPAGYALARVRPIASSLLFIILLSGIFLPPEATIVPLFLFASKLGWTNTLLPLIVFTAVLTTTPIATFIMRQAFLTLPGEFGEAATIDGATRTRTMLQIFIPLVRPSLASVVVISCWYSWNQFLEPLVYIRDVNLLTVPVALTHFTDPYGGPLWNVQMAATTLSVLPVLMVFLFAQKHVIAGLTAGGLKS